MSYNEPTRDIDCSFLLPQVVALGVVPYLLPGVGLPPEKRSKFLQYLLQTAKEVPIMEVIKTSVFVLHGGKNAKVKRNYLIIRFLCHDPAQWYIGPYGGAEMPKFTFWFGKALLQFF